MLIVIIALIFAAIVYWQKNAPMSAPVAQVAGYKNATYTIDGTPVTLVSGVSEVAAAPGSASKVVTRFFGNEATGDLNNDATQDVAFLLTQDTGGSGTFYYVVVAVKTASGYSGTNAVLLGDRIAPQTTEIQNGEVIVNYADRNAGEPMTAKPSVGKSKHLTLSGLTLAEAARAAALGERCGGNMLNPPVCGAGLHCAPSQGSHLPFGDVGGTCVAN